MFLAPRLRSRGLRGLASLACAAAPLLLAPGARAASLTLYSAQHEQMVSDLAATFTQQTGISVKIRSGEAPELASAIVREGSQSPADVYFTENSPELTLLDEKGLLGKVDAATLARVPARFSAADGSWLGVLARENVLAFNPHLIAVGGLPASLLDLAQPAWKGRIGIAPTDADFLPLVDAVSALKGRAAALAWLKGLHDNAQLFDDDEGVVAAVERGSVATGIINNYYWARLRTEIGAAKTQSQIHHFAGGDIGGLINVSGAAMLKSAPHPDAAQRFLAFLVDAKTQETLAKGEVDFEYPLVPGVAANPLLKPFTELQPPALTLQDLGDDQPAGALLREAGLI